MPSIADTIDRALGRVPPRPTPQRARAKPAQSADDTSALRVLRTLRLLQSRWWRVKELAQVTGRDEKTMRRDLAVIRRAGFRVQIKVEAFGRKAYRVTPRRKVEA